MRNLIVIKLSTKIVFDRLNIFRKQIKKSKMSMSINSSKRDKLFENYTLYRK